MMDASRSHLQHAMPGHRSDFDYFALDVWNVAAVLILQMNMVLYLEVISLWQNVAASLTFTVT